MQNLSRKKVGELRRMYKRRNPDAALRGYIRKSKLLQSLRGGSHCRYHRRQRGGAKKRTTKKRTTKKRGRKTKKLTAKQRRVRNRRTGRVVYRRLSKKDKSCHQRKMHKVMHEFKHGRLRTNAGSKVTNRKQAIAIGLSMARRHCNL